MFDLPVDEPVQNGLPNSGSNEESMDIDNTTPTETNQISLQINEETGNKQENNEPRQEETETEHVVHSTEIMAHGQAVLENGVAYDVEPEHENVECGSNVMELDAASVSVSDSNTGAAISDVTAKDVDVVDSVDVSDNQAEEHMECSDQPETEKAVNTSVDDSVESKTVTKAESKSEKTKTNDKVTLSQGKSKQGSNINKKGNPVDSKSDAKKPPKVQSKVAATTKTTVKKTKESETSLSKSMAKSLTNKRKSDASLHGQNDLPPGKKVANPKSPTPSNKKTVKENTAKTNAANTSKNNEEARDKKPTVKRTPPKSKWNTIMTQIDDSKTNGNGKAKPAVKKEVKSKIITTSTSRTTKSVISSKTDTTKPKSSRSLTPDITSKLKTGSKGTRGVSPDVSRSTSRVSSATDITIPDAGPSVSTRSRPASATSRKYMSKRFYEQT